MFSYDISRTIKAHLPTHTHTHCRTNLSGSESCQAVQLIWDSGGKDERGVRAPVQFYSMPGILCVCKVPFKGDNRSPFEGAKWKNHWKRTSAGRGWGVMGGGEGAAEIKSAFNNRAVGSAGQVALGKTRLTCSDHWKQNVVQGSI